MDRIIYVQEALETAKVVTMKDTHTKRVKIKKSLLQNTLVEAKKLEQKEVFMAQKEALLRCLLPYGSAQSFLETLEGYQWSVAKAEEAFKRFLTRICQRVEKRDPSLPLPSLESISSLNQVTKALHLQGWPKERISEVMKDLQEVEGIPSVSRMSKEYQSVVKLVKKLVIQLTETPKDFEKVNREVLTQLRNALRSRPYHLLKTDESHPLVHCLHTLALALFVEPKIGAAFKHLGEKLSSLLPQSNGPFHEVLRSASEIASKHGLIKNDRSLRYLFFYYKQLLGAFLSTNFGGKIGKFFDVEYDPKGKFGNSGGHFFDTIVTTPKRDVCVRNIFTPSPTIGNQIAPEFYALLQALENRNFFSKDTLEQDYYPYLVMAYTNLQDITSLDENRRSIKLMELNQQYPFSFQGITLSVDSAFYVAAVKQKENRDPESLDIAYLKKQIDQLTKEANFTLHIRCIHRGGGYYFPQISHDRNFWENEFHKIASTAFAFVKKKEKPEGMENEVWNWSLKAAFRELVLLSLVTVFQRRLCRDNEEKGGGVLATCACKENIDRGGKLNASLLWALGGKEDEVFNAFHSRALLARFRLIISSRAVPMYHLLMVVSQQEVAEYFKALDTSTSGTLKMKENK